MFDVLKDDFVAEDNLSNLRTVLWKNHFISASMCRQKRV